MAIDAREYEDRFITWLDGSPKDYDAWKVVETAAWRVSVDGGTYNIWGEARALSVMSGVGCDEIMDYIRRFAEDNYKNGERIDQT